MLSFIKTHSDVQETPEKEGVSVKALFPRMFFISLFLLSGCAGLNFKSEPVYFDQPEILLNIKEVDPTPAEAAGINLRLLMPESRESRAEENLKIYSQLHDGQGMSLNLRQKITITYKPVEGKDSYIQRTVTAFEGEAGRIVEEMEITPRGEILNFIEGYHESKAGKFKILNQTRTPIYPENKVKPGDRWSYEGRIDARLDSFWIAEKNPTPYVVAAESRLTGFADLNGRHCAVIKTRTTQTKAGTLKVLFRTVTVNITAEIEETDYVDYAAGLLVGRVTKSSSRSVFPDLKMEDEGVSQAIYKTVDSNS